jgi:hypothetical protein
MALSQNLQSIQIAARSSRCWPLARCVEFLKVAGTAVGATLPARVIGGSAGSLPFTRRRRAERVPFLLREATPNPERFPDLQDIGPAVGQHRAAGAHRLCTPNSCRTGLPALPIGMEKARPVHSPAGRPLSPFPVRGTALDEWGTVGAGREQTNGLRA